MLSQVVNAKLSCYMSNNALNSYARNRREVKVGGKLITESKKNRAELIRENEILKREQSVPGIPTAASLQDLSLF